MTTVYHNIVISLFDEKSKTFVETEKDLRLELEVVTGVVQLTFFREGIISCIEKLVLQPETTEIGRVGKKGLNIHREDGTLLITFPSENDLTTLFRKLKYNRKSEKPSLTSCGDDSNLFDKRTDSWSSVQYFQFYSFLSQQQNMMQDYVRTATYQRAVLSNMADFKNKVILDVGAGSGILSFFAIQGGAKKVYAVEASNMAEHCEALVMANKLAGKIIIIPKKIEEVELPEQVDLIISEPMGYMLYNERMLESFVHAKKFLKPTGKMFPTVANLYIAPFSDDALYMEQYSKANFWYQQSFHGVDLSSLREAAVKEYFRQPVVDTWDVQILLASPCKYAVNFETVPESELCFMDIPLKFTALQAGMVHGYAFWFDVGFLGSNQEVWLSTAPTEMLTHWYQVRCMFLTPVFVTENQEIQGRLVMRANSRQSYDVEIEMALPGMTRKVQNTLDLKNPCFRYSGAPTQPPPGTSGKSPTETFWGNIALQQQQQQQQQTGISMDVTTSEVSASVPFVAHAGAGGTSPAPVANPNYSINSTSNVSAQPMSISSQFMIGDYAAATATVAASRASPLVASRVGSNSSNNY